MLLTAGIGPLAERGLGVFLVDHGDFPAAGVIKVPNPIIQQAQKTILEKYGARRNLLLAARAEGFHLLHEFFVTVRAIAMRQF